MIRSDAPTGQLPSPSFKDHVDQSLIRKDPHSAMTRPVLSPGVEPVRRVIQLKADQHDRTLPRATFLLARRWSRKRSAALVFTIIGLPALLLTAAPALTAPSPGVKTSCNVVPLMMCGAPAPNPAPQDWDYGYTLNAPTPMRLAAPGGAKVGLGNFVVIQLPGGSGSDWVRQSLTGYEGCVTQGDSMQAHAGNEAGPVARDLSARLGVYLGNFVGSEARYPPDVITTQPSPALRLNLTARGCSWRSPCIEEGSNGGLVTASNVDSPEIFNYEAYEAALNIQRYTNAPPTGRPNRRILSVPMGDCSASPGSSSSNPPTIPVIGFACFFLLQPPVLAGNTLWIMGQYIGHCSPDGTPDPRFTPNRRLTSFSSTTANVHKPGPAKSSQLEGVDKEVDELVQELRDLPTHACTRCKDVSKVAEAERRSAIYDRFDALGSAAVPRLARILKGSLQSSDYDLRDTVLGILSTISGPYTSRDGKQHDKTDISAGLPVLILALDDRVAAGTAARLLGAMGPNAAAAVPKLVAMLDDISDMARADACWGLKGIDPLPGLRKAQSGPNLARRQFAQSAIASIQTQCPAWNESLTTLEELAQKAELICKATVTADRAIVDDSLKPAEGFEIREARLRAVSCLKSGPHEVIRFRYYAQVSESRFITPLRVEDRYMKQVGELDGVALTVGRTYLVVATQVMGDTYREMDAFFPPLHATMLYIGPPPRYFGLTSPGVLPAGDARPHHGTTLTEMAWSELLVLLKSAREDDVIGAIHRLDRMSGGPAWQKTGSTIFRRDETLVAIQHLVEAKNPDVAAATITALGGDSPYFYDQDVPFWLAGIGKGHITGLGPRKRPANSVEADIGRQGLLHVANDGATPKLRALAIRALGRSSHAAPAAMVALWSGDPNFEVRRAAVLVSADLPDHELITAASIDGSPDLRLMAALAIGFAQDARLVPLLDKLLHDPRVPVRNAAALSLLSYPIDQAAPVMKANLASDFRPLFVNALASADPQPYVSMLGEIIERQPASPSEWKRPADWEYGGTIPTYESWQILFDFVKSRAVAELTSGKLDSSLDALERVQSFDCGRTVGVYALYVNRGLVSRAKQFRDTARKTCPAAYNVDQHFDAIDRDPAGHFY